MMKLVQPPKHAWCVAPQQHTLQSLQPRLALCTEQIKTCAPTASCAMQACTQRSPAQRGTCTCPAHHSTARAPQQHMHRNQSNAAHQRSLHTTGRACGLWAQTCCTPASVCREAKQHDHGLMFRTCMLQPRAGPHCCHTKGLAKQDSNAMPQPPTGPT